MVCSYRYSIQESQISSRSHVSHRCSDPTHAVHVHKDAQLRLSHTAKVRRAAFERSIRDTRVTEQPLAQAVSAKAPSPIAREGSRKVERHLCLVSWAGGTLCCCLTSADNACGLLRASIRRCHLATCGQGTAWVHDGVQHIVLRLHRSALVVSGADRPPSRRVRSLAR